jgi:hypothetical protein
MCLQRINTKLERKIQKRSLCSAFDLPNTKFCFESIYKDERGFPKVKKIEKKTKLGLAVGEIFQATNSLKYVWQKHTPKR